jgi:hypothetical protein
LRACKSGIALHLLYDASWNILYWTVLDGDVKKVLRVKLSTDYSILEAASAADSSLSAMVSGGLTFEAAAMQPGIPPFFPPL